MRGWVLNENRIGYGGHQVWVDTDQEEDRILVAVVTRHDDAILITRLPELIARNKVLEEVRDAAELAHRCDAGNCKMAAISCESCGVSDCYVRHLGVALAACREGK